MAGRERSGAARGPGRPLRRPRLGRHPDHETERGGDRPRPRDRDAVGRGRRARLAPERTTRRWPPSRTCPQLAASLVAARLGDARDAAVGLAGPGPAGRHPDRGERPAPLDPDPRRQRPGRARRPRRAARRPRRGRRRPRRARERRRTRPARAAPWPGPSPRATPATPGSRASTAPRRRPTRPSPCSSPTSRASSPASSPTSGTPASTSRTCTSSTASAQPFGLAEIAVVAGAGGRAGLDDSTAAGRAAARLAGWHAADRSRRTRLHAPMTSDRHPWPIAIDGPSGSGKSSVSKAVARAPRAGLPRHRGHVPRADVVVPRPRDRPRRRRRRGGRCGASCPSTSAPTPRRDASTSAASTSPRRSATTGSSPPVSKVATNIPVRDRSSSRLQRDLMARVAGRRRVVAEGATSRPSSPPTRPSASCSPPARRPGWPALRGAARHRRRGRRRGHPRPGRRRDLADSTVSQFIVAAEGVMTVDTSDLDFDETVEAVLEVVAAATRSDARAALLQPPEPVGRTVAGAARRPRPSSTPSTVARPCTGTTCPPRGRCSSPPTTPPSSTARSSSSLAPRPGNLLVKKAGLPRPLRLGAALRRADPDRPHRRRPRRALRPALAVLERGGAVGIFPEGSRRRGDVAEVSQGAAWIALQSGAPVVPVAVLGTRRPVGRGGLAPAEERLVVDFGEPFAARPARAAVPGRVRLRLASEQLRDAPSRRTCGARGADTGIPLPADARRRCHVRSGPTAPAAPLEDTA